MAHGFSAEQVEVLLSIDSPRAEFFRRITLRSIGVLEQMLGYKGLLSPDLLAMAVALEPDIVRRAETHYVRVELAGRHTRGHTTVDWLDRTGQEPNVNLVLEMDTGRLWELLEAAVRWPPWSPDQGRVPPPVQVENSPADRCAGEFCALHWR